MTTVGKRENKNWHAWITTQLLSGFSNSELFRQKVIKHLLMLHCHISKRFLISRFVQATCTVQLPWRHASACIGRLQQSSECSLLHQRTAGYSKGSTRRQIPSVFYQWVKHCIAPKRLLLSQMCSLEQEDRDTLAQWWITWFPVPCHETAMLFNTTA